ncbi:PAP2 superfamily protein [Sediminihabitans luteus]|uniref:PAP2 superfamily protein n=1 Tax=Sediminihabitans luteus TaxID=1138585 RepID=A0A2M9D036_9CELL|nr:phosphatase PAP2 family protein [Sediminihabitans luteus]PJJ77519.1 PAP2 superfamily protein [Sediminihabitans luteus]GII98418.1 hypothetical protein Slu03_07960 [Sediminihabitans luteus]
MTDAPAVPVATARLPEAPVGPRVVAGVTGVVASVLVWVVWRFFVGTYAGQRLDKAAFDGAEFGQNALWRLAEPVLDVVSVAFVVLGIGAAMAIALIRRRWALAVQVAVLVAGANVTTQVLKNVVLGRENLVGGYDYANTLPSGHTTVAASVAAALLLAMPRRSRPLVALLGGTYAALTGVSTLVGQWHRPSDVVAALLVVLAWGGFVLAATPRSGLDRDPVGGGRRGAGRVDGTSWAVASLLALGGAVALALAGWSAYQVYEAADWARPTVTAYAGGAFGVIGVAALTSAVLLVLRQATAHPWRTPAGAAGAQ